MIPKASKGRLGVGVVLFGVVTAAKLAALSPSLGLVDYAIERTK